MTIETIRKADCKHAKIDCKNFGLQNLSQYLDLYVQSDILFFGDIFQNFRKKCLQSYELDPAQFRSAAEVGMVDMMKENRNKKMELL